MFFVSAAGSNTPPFDTLIKAAPTFYDLLIVGGIIPDTITVVGAISEPLTGSYAYDVTGAIVTGADSRSDQIDLNDNYFIGGAFRYLGIYTSNSVTPNSWMLNDAIEATNCRFHNDNMDTVVGAIQAIYPISITNSTFVGLQKLGGVVQINVSSGSGNIIVVNNTFQNILQGPQILVTGGTIGSLYFFDNILSYTDDPSAYQIGINIDPTFVADFQHDHNDSYPLGYDYYDSLSASPISPDITEINADPLFIGSGLEPLIPTTSSPCYHTGILKSGASTTDLLGLTRHNPPTMGAFEGPSSLVANFTATPLTADANSTVHFTDTSLGATAWSWDFGDAITSAERNPAHIYVYPGVYTVSLTVHDLFDSDTELKIEYIHINLVDSVTKFEYIIVAAAGYTMDIAPPPVYQPMYQTGIPSFSFTTKGVRVYIKNLDDVVESGFRRIKGPTLIFD